MGCGVCCFQVLKSMSGPGAAVEAKAVVCRCALGRSFPNESMKQQPVQWQAFCTQFCNKFPWFEGRQQLGIADAGMVGWLRSLGAHSVLGRTCSNFIQLPCTLHSHTSIIIQFYLSIYPSIYPSLSISLYLSLSISIYLYLSLSISIYLYLSLSISIYLYLSLSVYLSIYLSLSISPYLYLSLSISSYLYLSLSISIYLYLYLSLSISIYLYPPLSIYLSLSLSLSICLSVCLSVYRLPVYLWCSVIQ